MLVGRLAFLNIQSPLLQALSYHVIASSFMSLMYEVSAFPVQVHQYSSSSIYLVPDNLAVCRELYIECVTAVSVCSK